MEKPPNDTNRIIICALISGIIVLLFLMRSIFLFIPVGIVVVFLLWKMGGGTWNRYDEEDPADWWKKDRSPRED